MARQEGFTLADVRVELNDQIVGGIQSLTVTWAQENKAYGEAGTNKPLYIQDGSIAINGKVEKLVLDYDFIKKNFDLTNGYNPYFTLVGVNKKTGATVTVVDAKFKGFDLPMALGGEATKHSLDYDALDLIIK